MKPVLKVILKQLVESRGTDGQTDHRQNKNNMSLPIDHRAQLSSIFLLIS